MNPDAERGMQDAESGLMDLEQVWMQIALRAVAEPRFAASPEAAHSSHDSSITMATIHA